MGRKKGGRNRTKEEILAEQEAKASEPKRGRGRPKGSLNKPKQEEKPRRGRPPAPKNGEKKQKYTITASGLLSKCQNRSLPVAKTDEERAYNSRLIDHVMRIQEIATHADRSDVATLESCFIAYVRLCQEDGFSVSNLAAYTAMGFSQAESFLNYARKDDPEIKRLVTLVRSTCATFRETLVSANKLNPVIGIFWQRNFDGLRNDTEQVQSAREPEDEYSGSSNYKEKYKNLIGDD